MFKAPSASRFLSIRDVQHETTLSRSTIYRMVAKGEFPQPIKIGQRRISWTSDAIQRWKNERAGIAA